MATKPLPSFDPKSFLAMVGEGRSIGEYRKDQIVFSQGNPADAVFYIQNGKVKVSIVSKQGKEAVVAIHETSDFFGEGCLAGQTRRIATVATMMDSVIVRLEKAAIVRVIQQETAFSGMFIAHLLARAIRVEADLVDQLFNSSEKRLARLLLLLNGDPNCSSGHCNNAEAGTVSDTISDDHRDIWAGNGYKHACCGSERSDISNHIAPPFSTTIIGMLTILGSIAEFEREINARKAK